MHPKRQWNVQHKPYSLKERDRERERKKKISIYNTHLKKKKIKKTFPFELKDTNRKSFEKWQTKTALFFFRIDPKDIRSRCPRWQHPPGKTFLPHFSNTHCRTPNPIRMSRYCPNCHSYRIPIRCIWCDPLSFEPALPFINRMHKACFRDFVEQLKQRN